jgi:hypothetical protein
VPGGQRTPDHRRALGDVEALGRLVLGAQHHVGEAVVVGEALVGGVVHADDVEGGHPSILPDR